jgi:hypothetical protein
MRIDCRQCAMYESDHCDDCLVTALLHPPAETVEIDDALDPSLRALTDAGLVPVLRFRPRAEDASRDGAEETERRRSAG